MARFSKPQLETQADELNAQILAGLAEVGVRAEMTESGGIRIPEYHYDIACVVEPKRGSTWSLYPSGTLEVEFRSVYLTRGHGRLCHVKRFKVGTKDLIKKVVTSIVERRDAIMAQKAREKAEEKANRSHEAVLKSLRQDFSGFKGNIERHRSQISLNFHNLSEEQARLILGTLNAAGIKGDK